MSWARRHKRGVIVLAIAGGALALMIFAIVMTFVLFTFMKSSEPYATALAKARTNAEVVARLGEPIEPGWWVIGSLRVTGLTGQADLTYPLEGPHGCATLHVRAHKWGRGAWRYEALEVALPGHDEPLWLLPTKEDDGV